MPKVPHGMFDQSKAYPLDGVVLVDPNSGEPYKAGVTIQQVEGGFDPTGLATDDKQDAILSALSDLIAAVQANGSDGDVSIADEELPPVSGQATASKQDSILAALQNLAGILGGTLTVDTDGPIEVTASSVPLASGASTATKQDAILAAVNALAEIFRTDTLDVSGTVDINGTVPVSGSVSLTNASIAVTPSGVFTVEQPGSATSAKQDAILTALGNVLTAIQAPQPITDNGQSITVDGVVGVSGTIPVTDNGGSLTVDGIVGATQSGPWNVGITGTPTVNIGNTVTISDGNGPLTVDGTVGISGTVPVSVAATLPVSLASVPTHAVTQSGAWTQTPTGAATLTTTPTAVAVGTTSVSLVASQSGRRSLMIQNMGGTTLMLSFAATADATAPTFQVPAGGWIVIDRETWTGAVTGIRASGSATSNAIVTVTS